MASPIALRADDLSVAVDLTHGGRLASLAAGPLELLVTDGDAPMTWGAFPMAPWAGRLRDGRFDVADEHHEVHRNHPPHAIHGTVFESPWTLVDQGPTQLELRCSLDRHGWDLGGTARQRVTIGTGWVECELAVTAGDSVMPAEIGWHPWFVKPDRLHLTPDAMYVRGADGLPTGEIVEPRPGPWDDCFVNTSPVELHYGSTVVSVTSDCDHLVVFDEPEHATCVEPQSGPPDSFHVRPRLLGPGETLRRTMRIAVGNPAPAPGRA